MLIQMLVRGDISEFLIFALVFVLAIALHEFGHALAAEIQGDPTPRLAGRLTLNPLAHLDPVGSFFLVIVGFGWGKPVQFSPRKLRYQRAGAAIVALAGPAMNILLAVVGAVIIARIGPSGLLGRFAGVLLFLNCALAIFNLIPIPPLDGSRLLTLFLPPSKHQVIYFLDKWGFLLLFGLTFILQWPLGAATEGLGRAILSLFTRQFVLAPV